MCLAHFTTPQDKTHLAKLSGWFGRLRPREAADAPG
jgi:hypothetical protein